MTLWLIALALIIFFAIFLPNFDETGNILFFIFLTYTMAAAVTCSIFLRYASTDRFRTSAYLTIGITYFFAFSQIGLLAVDLSFTRYNRYY